MSIKKLLLIAGGVAIVLILIFITSYGTSTPDPELVYGIRFHENNDSTHRIEGVVYVLYAKEEDYRDARLCMYDSQGKQLRAKDVTTPGESIAEVNATLNSSVKYLFINSPDFWTRPTSVTVPYHVYNNSGGYDSYSAKKKSDLPVTPC
jgi:hypothetical protein